MNLRQIIPSTAFLGAVSMSLAVAASAQGQSLTKKAGGKMDVVKTGRVLPVTSADATGSTAATDPVGFITLSVAGNHGSGTGALSFLGQGMTRPVEWQSALTAASGTTLTDSKATWTDDQFNTVTTNGVTTGNAYYLEITSGTGVGLWADIVSTNGSTTSHSGTPNTVTLNADLSAYLTAGTTYKIRKNWTIAAIFGVNPTASDASGLAGGTSSTADQVLIYTPATYNSGGAVVTPAVYSTYYYQTTGFGGQGWRSTASNSVDASNTKMEPTSGVLVQRFQATDLTFAFVGAVKTGTTDLPIQFGLNFVSNVYPVSTLTLGTSGLYNPNDSAGNTLAGGTSSTADQVLIYTPATYNSGGAVVTPAVYSTYYYQTTGFGGQGWRSTASNSVDAASIVIPIGSSILIQRFNKTVAANGSFEWVAPQPF